MLKRQRWHLLLRLLLLPLFNIEIKIAMDRDTVEIYADGACKGNPGPGGWGVLLRYRTTEKELFGHETLTTNNRMELMAVIAGLQALKQPCAVIVSTDSQYVQKGISQWIRRWKKQNWMTSQKTAVKNLDLWQRLDTLAQRHEVKWRWIKGHAGHQENERADALAQRGIAALSSPLSLATYALRANLER